MKLAGQVGLVTGGASGIGRATAERFAAEGMRVCVVDQDAEGGRSVAEAVDGRFVAADVGDAAQVDAAFARCVDELGGLGVAYLNAGIAIGHGDIADLPDDVYRRIMRVNVDGVVFGVRRLARVMPKGSTIVATASLAGLTPVPDDPIYGLTKHAVVGFVRSVAPKLAEREIRIQAVCPGWADTGLMSSDFKDELGDRGYRLLRPEDVADGVWAAYRSEGTGEAWVVQPGREPLPYAFKGVPGPR